MAEPKPASSTGGCCGRGAAASESCEYVFRQQHFSRRGLLTEPFASGGFLPAWRGGGREHLRRVLTNPPWAPGPMAWYFSRRASKVYWEAISQPSTWRTITLPMSGIGRWMRSACPARIGAIACMARYPDDCLAGLLEETLRNLREVTATPATDRDSLCGGSAPVMIRCVGRYDPDLLGTAVRGILERHEGIVRGLTRADPAALVVVKPNWIQDSHQSKADHWEAVITHPELVLAVVRTVADAMGGVGTICICDAPNTDADFSKIVARGGLAVAVDKVRACHPQLRIEIVDLRREVWKTRDNVVVERRASIPDHRGYVGLNLGEGSLFHGHRGEGRYYGADYDSSAVNRHHHGTVQEYLLSGTAVECDLFINLPKMKTHKKTGITCSLKNLVGINGDKNWLPHHTRGTPSSGGDEFTEKRAFWWGEQVLKTAGQTLALKFPAVGTALYRWARLAGLRVVGDSEKIVRAGNWSGNDTCWRMALDLNRALLYANSDGTWRDRFQPKAYLAIVDGIIGGEGNGPLCPDPVQSNVLVSGTNPAEVDAVVARLMGFDPTKIPIIRHAFDAHRWPITTKRMDEISVFDERLSQEVSLDEVAPAVKGGFTPHFGWDTLRAGDGT